LFVLLVSVYSVSTQNLPLGSECTASNNVPGTCTLFASCAPVMAQVKAKTLQINPPVVCNQSLRIVCCPLPTTTTTTTTTTTSTTTTTEATTTTVRRRVVPTRKTSPDDETAAEEDDPAVDEVVAQGPRISELSKKKNFFVKISDNFDYEISQNVKSMESTTTKK
jgi:hypothetical protein